MTAPIRILFVDDHDLWRKGIMMVIDSQPDLEVIAEARNGREAVELAATVSPDVVLMDVRMPEMDGVEATRTLVSGGSGVKILILTTFDLDEYAYAALRAGASGFLLKDAPSEDLLSGLRAVASGDAVVAPSTTGRLLEALAGQLPEPGGGAAEDPRVAALTPREREVVIAVARGRSNAEIADELVVAEATVKTHVGRILAKLDLRDRVQIAILAYETRLVTPDGGRG